MASFDFTRKLAFDHHWNFFFPLIAFGFAFPGPLYLSSAQSLAI